MRRFHRGDVLGVVREVVGITGAFGVRRLADDNDHGVGTLGAVSVERKRNLGVGADGPANRFENRRAAGRYLTRGALPLDRPSTSLVADVVGALAGHEVR